MKADRRRHRCAHCTGWSLLFLCAIFALLALFTAALFENADAASSESSERTVAGSSERTGSSESTVAGEAAAADELRAWRFRDAAARSALATRHVLVRGFAKSGTSWTRLLLDLHPRVHMLPYELQLAPLDRAVAAVTRAPWQAARAPYRELLLEWHAQLLPLLLEQARRDAPRATFVGEKSPTPVAPIERGARYLYVLRDARDVLVSLLAHRVRLGGFVGFCANERMFGTPAAAAAAEQRDWAFFEREPHALLSHAPCVRELARRWAQRVRDDLRELARYRERDGADKVRIVRYEDMVADTETERANMYSWLGLEPAESSGLGLYTMPLSKLPPDSRYRPDNLFFRKGAPGDWRNYFHDDAKNWFKATDAQTLLQQLEYVRDDNW